MNTALSTLFRRAIPILIGLLLIVRLIGMAVVPLMDTTEARYGEIGRKMAELNDWVTPWFDYGVPYWGKPPLAFWVTAASFKVFGVNEFAARLPHLIISLLIVGLVAWMAARRDHSAALSNAALMSGSFLYFISAGIVMTDIELVFGTTLTMAGFWLALEDSDGRHSSSKVAIHYGGHASLLFFGGLILGLLAKGPVTLAMAGAPLFFWTVYNRRWLDVWRRLPWLRGILLTLLAALPWYWLAEQHTPGFLEYFLIGEHWQRFVTPGWHGDRYGNAHIFPIGTIWAFAFVDTLPWSLLLPIAAWSWRRKIAASTKALIPNRANTAVAAPGLPPSKSDSTVDFITDHPDERVWQGYLLIWAITPLLFFTMARNIIMTYALPGLPAAAILVGGWLAHQHRQGCEINRWLGSGLLITLLVMCGVAVVNISQPDKMEHKSLKTLLAAYDYARIPQGSLHSSHSPGTAAAQSDAPLIFIGFRPFSAQFYSHGRAIKVANDEEAWRRIGTGAGYVVTRPGDAFVGSAGPKEAGEPPYEMVPAATFRNERVVTRIGHYGDYDLLFVAAQ